MILVMYGQVMLGQITAAKTDNIVAHGHTDLSCAAWHPHSKCWCPQLILCNIHQSNQHNT